MSGLPTHPRAGDRKRTLNQLTIGYAAWNELAGRVWELRRNGHQLEAPLAEDYLRSAEILRQYSDANLDLVDALIAATAERLNIIRILTLDRRDFQLIRPRHCEGFELLP